MNAGGRRFAKFDPRSLLFMGPLSRCGVSRTSQPCPGEMATCSIPPGNDPVLEEWPKKRTLGFLALAQRYKHLGLDVAYEEIGPDVV